MKKNLIGKIVATGLAAAMMLLGVAKAEGPENPYFIFAANGREIRNSWAASQASFAAKGDDYVVFRDQEGNVPEIICTGQVEPCTMTDSLWANTPSL